MIEIKNSTKQYLLLKAPSSKAHTLRSFFMAGLSDGTSIIINPLMGDDQKIALNCLKLIGAEINIEKNLIEIKGVGGTPRLKTDYINCGNSGVTLRFLIPIISLIKNGFCVVDGNKDMRRRTVEDLIDALSNLGVSIEYLEKKGFPPVKINCNAFQGGKTKIKGSKSSQFLSALLIAGSCTKLGLEIDVQGNLVSKPYVSITIDLMRKFGILVQNDDFRHFSVAANQNFELKEIQIEGDYSNASYFFLAAAICKMEVKVENLLKNSVQGDKIILDILGQMGCEIDKKKTFCIVRGKSLKGITIDMANYPDIVPTVAIAASFAEGITIIKNIGHLKHKETDRILAVSNELKKIGIDVKQEENSLIIKGGTHKGGVIETYNDHRIAMSFAVVGLAVKNIRIKNPSAVAKSFPDFFEVLSQFY